MNAGLWAGLAVAFVLSVVIAYRAGMAAADDADAVAHAGELAAAFNRGVEAGERRAADREREKRSAAGTKAAATRRNRVTGETLPMLDEQRSSSGTVTVTPGLNVTTTNADAPFTLTGLLDKYLDAPGRAD